MALTGEDVTGRALVLFDFDGTLADTVDGICATARTVLRAHGVPEGELARVPQIIGPPFPQAFSLVFGLSEEEADFSKVTAEVNRTRRPVTLLKNNRPWVVVAPADPSAVDVASDFMDEYADVFEELAK